MQPGLRSAQVPRSSFSGISQVSDWNPSNQTRWTRDRKGHIFSTFAPFYIFKIHLTTGTYLPQLFNIRLHSASLDALTGEFPGSYKPYKNLGICLPYWLSSLHGQTLRNWSSESQRKNPLCYGFLALLDLTLRVSHFRMLHVSAIKDGIYLSLEGFLRKGNP